MYLCLPSTFLFFWIITPWSIAHLCFSEKHLGGSLVVCKPNFSWPGIFANTWSLCSRSAKAWRRGVPQPPNCKKLKEVLKSQHCSPRFQHNDRYKKENRFLATVFHNERYFEKIKSPFFRLKFWTSLCVAFWIMPPNAISNHNGCGSTCVSVFDRFGM